MNVRTLDMISQDSASQQRPDRVAVCPTCGCTSVFSYAGETRWPERVAARVGCDPVVTLWNCGACDTTLSEPSLEWV